MKYIVDTTTGLDSNSVGATGDTVFIKQTKRVSIIVIPKTGTHTTYVIGLQVSPDDISWAPLLAADFSVAASTSNIASKTIDIVGACVRPIVLTAEGAASTVDVIIMSK